MPGSIIANMPPRDDDPQRRARDAQRLAREQASAKSGQAMQIGAGGIDVTDGGSITIEGTGALHVGSGALDSAGSITAGTDITAGGTVQGADVVSTGGATVAGGMSVGGALTAASVNSGDVISSGQVQSNGSPFLSVPSHNYIVNKGNWVAGWIDEDGSIGTSPSAGAVKTSLTPMDGQEILNVVPYWGRYIWDAPDSPLKSFLIAEDVQAAGFGTDVAPVVTGTEPQNVSADPASAVMVQPGQAWTVNYSQLVPALLGALRTQAADIAELQSRLKAAGIA